MRRDGWAEVGPSLPRPLRSFYGKRTYPSLCRAIAEVLGFGRNLMTACQLREGLERKFLFEPGPLPICAKSGKSIPKPGPRIRDDRDTLWGRLDTAFNARMLTPPIEH